MADVYHVVYSAMATRTFHGSCHCKGLRFEVDLDLDRGSAKCNCSYCWKVRNWSMAVKPEAFRWLASDTLGQYGFTPASVNHHDFCTRCGVRVATAGEVPGMGTFASVALATLDDLPTAELVAVKVAYANGRDNDWMHPPDETRHL